MYLPAEVRTIRELRDYVGFEELQAQHPAHDVVIVVSRKVPDCPCAIVLRLRKELHIQDEWPWLISYNTRVVVLYPPNGIPMEEGVAA